jgi:hypothetical protein
MVQVCEVIVWVCEVMVWGCEVMVRVCEVSRYWEKEGDQAMKFGPEGCVFGLGEGARGRLGRKKLVP